MGDDSRLDAQSLLPDGTQLPPGAQRRGSPGMAAEVPVPPGDIYRPSLRRQIALRAARLARRQLARPGRARCRRSPWLWLLLLAFQGHGLEAAIGLTAGSGAGAGGRSHACGSSCSKRSMLRRAKPGVYPLYSVYYLRHWLAYGLMRASRAAVAAGLHHASICRPGCACSAPGSASMPRCRRSGVSCRNCSRPANSAFFADGCMFGGKRVFGGRFRDPHQPCRQSQLRRQWRHPADRQRPGRPLPAGRAVSAAGLRARRRPNGTDWLGSPAFQLPNRQKVGGFSEEATYRPTAKALCPARHRRCAAHPDPGLYRLRPGARALSARCSTAMKSTACGSASC